jgi:hypothetical protein
MVQKTDSGAAAGEGRISAPAASPAEHQCPATNGQFLGVEIPIRPSLALVVGIDAYTSAPQLRTALQDARCVGRVLRELHGFDVQLLDSKVTAERLRSWLIHWFEHIEKNRTPRLLFYFAGHGFAVDSVDGPQGYFIPENGDPANVDTFISMKWLHEVLVRLPCEHVLSILDCCFAGSFRWSATRQLGRRLEKVLHQERYHRFIGSRAWQVLTSASFDEMAQDVFVRRGVGLRELDQESAHSPFAHALLRGLAGEACRRRIELEDGRWVPDGVITATDLYQFVLDQVFRLTGAARQTPTLWPFGRHRSGEYVFLQPGFDPARLAAAPKMDEEANPYMGLQPFQKKHSELFFGRKAATEELKKKVDAEEGLTVISGPSGTGKSSRRLPAYPPSARTPARRAQRRRPPPAAASSAGPACRPPAVLPSVPKSPKPNPLRRPGPTRAPKRRPRLAS